MTSNEDSQKLMAILENEISAIEEGRDALPDEAHLRTLCDFAAERLRDFVPQPHLLTEAMQDDMPFRLSA